MFAREGYTKRVPKTSQRGESSENIMLLFWGNRKRGKGFKGGSCSGLTDVGQLISDWSRAESRGGTRREKTRSTKIQKT